MVLQPGALTASLLEGALWYVLTGTRGGTNRVRLLRALDKRPRNANQLADDLDLDYKTVRHHLDVLVENSTGDTVVVDTVTLHNGGFVTVHDSSLHNGGVIGSIRGTSESLAPGTHETVEITLDDPLKEDDTIFAMAHLDTNGNQMYDFVTSEGSADGPYVVAGAPVMDSFDVSAVDDEMDGEDDEMDSEDDEMDDENDGTNGENASGSADDGGPEFGVLAAVIAVLGASFIALRRRN